MRKNIFILISLILISYNTAYSISHKSLNNTNNSKGFIENNGQVINQNNKVNKQALFILDLDQMNIQIRENGFSYDTYSIEKLIDSNEVKNNAKSNHFEENADYIANLKLNFHRIDVDFLNINPNCKISTHKELLDNLNYYDNRIKNKEISNVKKYKRIVYNEIYNHIDLELLYINNSFKYNFILKPGANINDIKWQYKGANNVELISNKISITTNNSKIIEDIPLSYYTNHEKKEVIIKYKNLGNNTFGFKNTNDNNKTDTLIIDPIPELMWATYYGGILGSTALDVTTNSTRDIFVGGEIYNTNNLATSGAFQSTIYTTSCGYFSKFTEDGQQLYATYYSAIKEIRYIECDKNNDITIAGPAYQDSLGTAGVFQEYNTPLSYPGNRNLHIARFNNNGQRKWATYFSDNIGSYWNRFICTLDSNSNVFITGPTTSTSNLSFITPGTYQDSLGSKHYEHSILVKLDTSANLIWGTNIAAEAEVTARCLATDKWGNVIITGYTEALYNIATAGTYMHNLTLYGIQSGFLMKFSPYGQKIWGTYLGTNNVGTDWTGQGVYHRLEDITTDKNGAIYFTGSSMDYASSIYGGDTVTTAGVHQEIFAGGYTDAFLSKFHSDGTRAWATYYGGNKGNHMDSEGAEYGRDIIIDKFNNVYMLGMTRSSNNIATNNALNQYNDTLIISYGDTIFSKKGFIVKFDSLGQRYYGTYYGSDTSDYVNAFTMDNYGKIIIATKANGSNFYTNSNSHLNITAYSGYSKGHIGKLSDCDLPDIPTVIPSDISVCPGGQIILNISGQLNDATQWHVYQNNILLANIMGISGSAIINLTDTNAIHIKGMGGCVFNSADTIIKIKFDSIPIVNAPNDTALCQGYGLMLTATGNAINYQWSNGHTNGLSYAPASNYEQLYVTATGANGCINSDTINIWVNPVPNVSYTNGFDKICLEENPRPVYGGLPAGGIYSGLGLYAGIFYPDSVGVGSFDIAYEYTDANGCSASAIDNIIVETCIGINELAKQQYYELYPNPAKDIININTININGTYRIIIYDNNAKLIKEIISSQEENKININELSAGNYHFIIIQNNIKIAIGSFIKN